jgi:hypothetical protein
MSREKALLLYSEHDDPIVIHLLKNQSVHSMHVDEIAPLIGSADAAWEYSDPDGSIQKVIGSQFHNKFIVNRVFSLEHTAYLKQLKTLGFTDRWAFIILKSLVERAPQAAYDTGPRGVSKSLQPLHLQWLLVREALPLLATPKFSYAFADLPPDLSNMTDPFQKSIWSFADWQVENHLPPIESKHSRFFVERPIGVPFVCYFLGAKAKLIFPKGKADVDVDLLSRYVNKFREIFRSELGEALFYLEPDGNLRFYSFSPFLYTAAEDRSFESEVIEFFSQNLSAAA